MTNYDNAMFSGTNAATNNADADAETYDVRKWKLGDHYARPTVDANQLRSDAERNEGIDNTMAEVLGRAAEQVESASVRDFECPVCGLSHGHGDKKHDTRSTFSVAPEFADYMEFAANCHCGVSELAMLMEFYGEIAVQVFEDDERFVAFESLMPSDEADMALALYFHPEVKIVDHMPRSKFRTGIDQLRELAGGSLDDLAPSVNVPKQVRSSWDQIERVHITMSDLFVAARLPTQDSVFEAFDAYTNRVESIRKAASGAPIPQPTDNRIAQIREDLSTKFDQ